MMEFEERFSKIETREAYWELRLEQAQKALAYAAQTLELMRLKESGQMAINFNEIEDVQVQE